MADYTKPNSIVKPQLDSNKMHLEEIQRIMQTVDPDEAKSIIRIMVRRYPKMVTDELGVYLRSMEKKIAGLYEIMGSSYDE